jgi:N-alpha-acetyltransferase 15/16, NatA auxiliary subunit
VRYSLRLKCFICRFLSQFYSRISVTCGAIVISLAKYNKYRSHVCWHVYGLLHRSDHDYNEAIKAYKQALRVDPKNLQILRDLSMLQIQLRDTEGFAITRNTLLALKPNAKINWMAFALARHMSGDLQGAVSVIDIYLGTLTEGSAELGRSYESSELALYKNSILAEIPNNFNEALNHLNACEAITVDRGAWLTKRTEYQLKLKEYDAAKQTIYQLLDRGMTEDHTIHSMYMCIVLQVDDSIIDEALRLRGTQTLATMMPLSDEQKQIILDAYRNDLSEKYPNSNAVQRIPISLMDDIEFRRNLDIRCRKDLQRGVPSLCSELKSYLWTIHNGRFVRTNDPVDVKMHPRFLMFVNMVDGYITNLVSCSKFAPEDEMEEEPSTLFWAWYLRAALHEMAGECVEGIACMDKCLVHTPTAVDAFELKALLLMTTGNMEAAVTCIDTGRDLDRADRYINNQTTKYMLQAGQESEALKRISMFTRHEGNPEQNLYDMQCSWYELELAACLARKEEWGRSLKKYGEFFC